MTQPGELESLRDLVVPVSFVVEAHCDASGNCERERAPVAGGWLIDLHLQLLSRPAAPMKMRAGRTDVRASPR